MFVRSRHARARLSVQKQVPPAGPPARWQRIKPLLALSLLPLVFLAGDAAAARTLSLEERVDAQRAIDRVYFKHQIGATRSSDEPVPAAVIERKVRAYADPGFRNGRHV